MIGSLNNALHTFDLNQCRITNSTPLESGATCLIKSTGMVYIGQNNGRVSVKDIRSQRDELDIEAHGQAVCSMDVKSNVLVTCGFIQRGGKILNDSIKVFDMRMKRLTEIINFSGYFVKFHPTFSTNILMVSQQGHFEFMDISSKMRTEYNEIQCSGEIVACNMSSSGNVLGFSDISGLIHVWSDHSDIPITMTPHNLLDAPTPLNYPRLTENSSFTLPSFYEGLDYRKKRHLLSDIENPQFYATSKPSEPINPELLNGIHYNGFVGVIPNTPGSIRRNQTIRYTDSSNEKFMLARSEDHLLIQKTSLNKTTTIVPPSFKFHQQLVDEKKALFEDFNCFKYNKTPFIGLENGISDSYFNALIQTLYFIPHLRVSFMNHVCKEIHCLLCELGFLFYIMDVKASRDLNATQAKNFYRSLKSIPKAQTFLEEPVPGISASVRFYRLYYFLLSHLDKEFDEHEHLDPTCNQSCSPDTLFGTPLENNTTCSTCQQKEVITTKALTLDVIYPNMDKIYEQVPSFSTLLERTLYQESTNYSFCLSCQGTLENSSTRIVKELPNILSLTFKPSTDVLPFWEFISDDVIMKGSFDNQWIPTCIKISRDEQSERWFVESLPNDHMLPASDDIYELTTVVSSIMNPKTKKDNIVTQIKVSHDYHDRKQTELTERYKWYLFNDFHVTNTSTYDVLHIDHRWKIPLVLQYRKIRIESIVPIPPYVNPINETAFFLPNPYSQNNTPSINITPEQLRKIKKVSLDSEFVLTRAEEIIPTYGKNMKKPPDYDLARVSVIGVNKKEEILLMDDYIETQSKTIVDYVTQYSGIVEGDLDPATSKHCVSPLKYTYLKLRYLVDSGRKLIGHGLRKDFRIMNLYVPPAQVLDTVILFRIEGKRLISLKFLTSMLMKTDIQESTHDSIEDSKAALSLYRKYKQLVKEGRFEEVLDEVYKIGHLVQWKSGEL